MGSFTEKFYKIKEILKNNYNIDIDECDYDGFIVKQMSESNCIAKNISSNQSHIAITGKQTDLFPYIYSKKFILEDDENMKNYFVIKAPVNIFKNNCETIENGIIDFKDKEILKEEMCIYPRRGGSQIQLSMKTNGDSRNFLKFRKLIKVNDYLVLMKKKNVLGYDGFIIEKKFISGEDYKSPIEFLRASSKDITFIKEDNIEYVKEINKPYQRIFFGAPGTGKSYKLNKEANEYFEDNYERVIFHPNYMYSNFIGVFKPFPIKIKDNENTIITYKYVPGILLKMILNSLKNPTQNYLLIIEEINRANISSVFGEFFQLLDRDKDGNSQYHINVTEDIKLYIQEELESFENDIKANTKAIIGKNCDKLILPKNLYIWATMNSADQGVMPLDTAFKRRWEFEYIGIDEGEDEISNKYAFKISTDGTTTYWNNFRKEINSILSNCRVPEDKLMGPYFIPKHILEGSTPNELTQIISNKVLMYLYEDVGRAHRNQIFNQDNSKTFSSLKKAFDENINSVFKNSLNLTEVDSKDDNNISEELE